MIRSSLFLLFFVGLAACGGGGGGPVVEDVIRDGDVSAPPTGGNPQTPGEEFDDRFGSEGTDEDGDIGPALEEALGKLGAPAETLIRVEFTREPGTGDSTVAIVSGIRNADGDAIRVSTDIPGTYDHTYAFVGDSDGSLGVFGNPTASGVMPTTGTASFAGGAVGVLVLGGEGFDLRNGESDVTVNFGAGTARIELGGFETISTVSGNLATAPFDTITLSNAQISGTTLSGGTLTLGGGQTLAQVIGDNRRTIAQGQFYGATAAASGPAEVGGVVFSEGDNGLLFGSYIAK